jgi:hypothetical protein
MPERMNAHDRGRLRLLGGPVRVGLLVLVAYAVLGAVAGVVWEWLWTPPGQVIVQHQVFYDSYSSLRRVFTGTGLYVLVAAVASALLALLVTVLVRGRELLVLATVVLGSAVAAALMWRVGTLLGPADPAGVAAHTAGRSTASGDLTVAGKSPYLIWPMVSLFVLSLVYFAWPASFATGEHSRPRGAEHREAEAPSTPPR